MSIIQDLISYSERCIHREKFYAEKVSLSDIEHILSELNCVESIEEDNDYLKEEIDGHENTIDELREHIKLLNEKIKLLDEQNKLLRINKKPYVTLADQLSALRLVKS